MSDWQPIETAPKDGTAVWLFVEGEAFIGYCQPADIFNSRLLWFIKATVRRRDRATQLPDEIIGCYAFDVAPTHWMPLPDPPALSVAQAAGR